MYSEKRQRTRTNFVTDVTLVCENSEISFQAELRDISIAGMFVHTDEELPIGSKCDITITITAKNSRLILENIIGEIVRQSETGAAIRFTSNMEWFVLFKIYTHYSKGDSTWQKEFK